MSLIAANAISIIHFSKQAIRNPPDVVMQLFPMKKNKNIVNIQPPSKCIFYLRNVHHLNQVSRNFIINRSTLFLFLSPLNRKVNVLNNYNPDGVGRAFCVFSRNGFFEKKRMFSRLIKSLVEKITYKMIALKIK